MNVIARFLFLSALFAYLLFVRWWFVFTFVRLVQFGLYSIIDTFNIAPLVSCMYVTAFAAYFHASSQVSFRQSDLWTLFICVNKGPLFCDCFQIKTKLFHSSFSLACSFPFRWLVSNKCVDVNERTMNEAGARVGAKNEIVSLPGHLDRNEKW